MTGRTRTDGRKPNGKWVDRWSDPVTGQHRQRTFDRKGDRDRFKRERIRQQQLGGLAALLEPDVSVAEYVEHWYEAHALVELTAKTRKVYAHAWAKHLLPRVGTYGLREVTPEVVLELRRRMAKAKVGDAMQAKALVMLQSVFTLAVTEQKTTGVLVNPVALVRKPRVHSDRQVPPIRPEAVEQLRARLAVRDAAMVSVLAYAGLRPQELLALHVEDIGPRSLFIARKAVDGELVGYTKTEPHRSVELLAPLRADLRDYMLATGIRAGLLFPRPDGGPWRETDWRNWRRRVYRSNAEKVGLPASRPYDLRGSWVSLLVWEGRTMLEVSRMAGHTVATSDRHYARIFESAPGPGETRSAEGAIRAARDAISAGLRGSCALNGERGSQ